MRSCAWSLRLAAGRFDPEHGERAAVLQVVERANLLAQHGYAVSWAYYNKPEDGARRDGEDLLEDTRRLEEDFSPDEPPRCALPEGASVGASVAAIVELAKRHGRALIESLKGLVQDAGGSYVWGPRKKEGRIREKAEKEYGGDVARVVDVERATGIFDSVDDLSLAITRLKRARAAATSRSGAARTTLGTRLTRATATSSSTSSWTALSASCS